MSEARRLALLALISVAASLVVAGVIIGLTYRADVNDTFQRLQDAVQTQSRLIEAIVRYEIANNPERDPISMTLGQIIDAHESFAGFGITGEFALARSDGDQILFLSQQRVAASEAATSIPFDAEWAEPMRRALLGGSGTIRARDYRGEIVFAAYQPVAQGNFGLVAKIDRDEILSRFVPAAVTAVIIALLVAAISAWLFVHLSEPIIRRLNSQKADLEGVAREREATATRLRAREEQQRIVASLGLRVLQGLTLDELFAEATSQAATLLGVEYSKILELHSDKSALLLRAGVGWQNGLVGQATVPAVGGSQAAFTLRSQEPVVVSDMRLESRFSPPALLLEHAVRSGINVIIGDPSKPWGVLGVHATQTRDFDAMDVNFVQALANLLGGTIKRTQMEAERLMVERQMQQAQKLESLGVLAGGIAHDFNNILMTILGNADMALLDLAPEAPSRPSVEAIETAARRAAGLAKQMLAYSGKGQFVVENLSINNLVDEMAHLLDASVPKNIILKYSLGHNLLPVRGDASQISQILMNLIINASDAIGEKSGVIQITTGVMDCDREYLDSMAMESQFGLDAPLAEGLYTWFLISDTGCGIPPASLTKIFEPFFTTKRAGRGLGLAAMLGIVRGHNGAVKIYSEVGKGSSFKVMLPANTNFIDAAAVSADVTTTQDSWHGTGTVLLVDDDESIVALGKRTLGRLGFTPLTAGDGAEAVDEFREHQDEIVCVILDLTMPRMSGADAFSKIRKLDPDIKVILCSGYDEEQVTQEFAGKGLAGFLHKPYTLQELREKMRQVLG